jgi:hypothetical protein
MENRADGSSPAGSHLEGPPLGLRLFTFALMGPGCAINGAFVAITIPAMAQYGVPGMAVAAAIGFVLGTFPARWLARKIHEGLNE